MTIGGGGMGKGLFSDNCEASTELNQFEKKIKFVFSTSLIVSEGIFIEHHDGITTITTTTVFGNNFGNTEHQIRLTSFLVALTAQSFASSYNKQLTESTLLML